MRSKTIKLKVEGKTVYQFDVIDAQLKLAKKLGISEKDFITELAKVHLDEHYRKQKDEI